MHRAEKTTVAAHAANDARNQQGGLVSGPRNAEKRRQQKTENADLHGKQQFSAAPAGAPQDEPDAANLQARHSNFVI
jgi:hypothetical protein